MLHKETQSQRACKVLRKQDISPEEKKMLKNEIEILKDMVRASGIFIRSRTTRT